MNNNVKDIERINLRDAFPPMPEELRKALSIQLESFQDEEKVRRITLRPVLIAAIIIVLMTSIAYAATKLGWVEYFKEMFGISVTKQTQMEMEASIKKTVSVGPVSFTIKEFFSDGRLLLGAADIQAKDGKGKVYGDITEIDSAIEEPIYIVRYVISVQTNYQGDDEAMEDYMISNDALTYFSMVSVKVEQEAEFIPATVSMYVSMIDPNTGKRLDNWKTEEGIMVPVNHQGQEQEYIPEKPFIIDGMTLLSVTAKRTSAGIYLRMNFQAGLETDPKMLQIPDFSWESIEKNKYDSGISLTLSVETDAWPRVVIIDMISTDKLPEEILLTDNDNGMSVLLEAINEG